MTIKKESKIIINPSSKLTIIRTSSSLAGESKSLKALQKKVLNIPVGDVEEDPDYEVRVLDSFQLPPHFIRHTKKIGDEPDITVDYCIEDEDLVWMKNHPKFSQDFEVSKYLTIESFEKIITFLEKHTGFATDLIPQSHAEKLFIDQFKWPLSITNKITVEVYQYWVKKRESIGKPLCRKYWPSTPSSDNNPHHCFRPRDKERYRLRKQQRKNDIDAYRKMQQLRREFGRARELLQLISERESLNEASIALKREIFEIEVSELDTEDIYGLRSKREREDHKPFQKYKLQYPHLLTPDSGNRGLSTSTQHALTPAISAQSQEKLTLILSRAPKSSYASAVNKIDQTVSSETQLLDDDDMYVPSSGLQRKRDRKQKRKQNLPAGTTTGQGDGGDRPTSPSLISPFMHTTLFPGLPGPAHFCRPLWPSFMIATGYGQTSCTHNYLDYLQDLELRRPIRHTLYGISGVNSDIRVIKKKPDETLTSNLMNDDDDDDDDDDDYYEKATLAPIKYRCRGRIGRGGRFVLDRIPLYYHSDRNDVNFRSAHVPSSKWLYASDPPMSTKPHQGVGSELSLPFMPQEVIPLINSTLSDPYNVPTQSILNTSFPVTMPISNCALPLQLISREKEIYTFSDSEDEAIEFINPRKGPLYHNKSSSGNKTGQLQEWDESLKSSYKLTL